MRASALRLRTARIVSCTKFMSAMTFSSISASLGFGHPLRMMKSVPNGKACHSSSVTNGMIGCMSLRTSSNTASMTACTVFLRASPSSPRSAGFASSMYQSQSSLHVKSYMRRAASPKKYPSSSRVISAETCEMRLSIHLSWS